MPCYAPEVTESVIDQYLHTDKPVALIARDHEINERDVTRIRHAAGVPARGARVRSLPPAMAALLETRALLRATGGGPSDDANPPPTPAPSPPLAPLVGGESAIDRIERLVAQELAAEEAGRAQLGLLPRGPGDAERCARTLAILTRTLQALARLRGGATEHGLRHDDDDMPADIDEFRNQLARRIDAFVASRTDGRNAGGVPEPAPPDQTR